MHHAGLAAPGEGEPGSRKTVSTCTPVVSGRRYTGWVGAANGRVAQERTCRQFRCFLGERVSDIRRKLQTLNGAFGVNLSPLVDVAFKMFNNREQ